VGLYIDTSKLKWIFWTSHHSVLLIDMLLKSRRNLGTKTNGSLNLQICNNQSMRKTTLTNNFLKTSLSHRKRRVTGRQRRTLENGVISTKSLGTTPMNVAQNSHWWLRSKTRSRTLIQNLILKILVKDRSSTQTPLLLS
jgi:septin family protein